MYPYPLPYPTMRTCESCGSSLRLVDFRRWSSESGQAKRLLFNTCNFCDRRRAAPPELAAARGELNPIVAQGRAARAEARAKAKRSDHSLRIQQRARRQAWNEAIFIPLKKELAWASIALTTAHDRCVDDTRYRGWRDFFEAYVQVLRDIQHRARARLGIARGGKRAPPDEVLDLMHYLEPGTLGSLRRLYGACTLITGQRTFREPTLLFQWRTRDADAVGAGA